MTYTDEQMKKIAVDAFRLGMRIGEKRASRADDLTAVADAAGVTRTRGHLSLIAGGGR